MAEEEESRDSRLANAEQLVQQAAQAARQATQQAEQAVQAAQQAARGVGAETSAATIETDVSPVSIGDAWRANVKRTYDEYQQESIESLRMSRRISEQLAEAHADHVRDLQTQITRMHTNSVTHDANLQAQHLAHRDLAVDRTWNIDEVAALVAKTPVFQDAIAGAVARAAQDASKDNQA